MMTRRMMLGLVGGAMPGLGALPSLFGADNAGRGRLGIDTNSYTNHWKAARAGYAKARFTDTLGFIKYCQQLGAGGVQVSVGSQDMGYAEKLRAQVEAGQLYFEGEVSMPRQESEVPRFEAQVRLSKAAGAAVVRTAMLGGRRYETFDSAEAYQRFAAQAWQSLTLAEPVIKRNQIRLAIENHKDYRASELADFIKRMGSEYVGVCVDTGNNLALLEDPLEVVEALAPYAFAVHFKDMAVHEYEEGFLLSEVPLGDGLLDLKRIVALLLKANPRIHFSLEMITRDPLKIPCLTDKYWATFSNVPARSLAALLRLVRGAQNRPLPNISGLDLERQLELEDENVRKSLTFARENLGL